MLKFQDDYTTIIATFEDFILLVYAIIDDLYPQFVPSSVSQRRNITSARMSDSETITLSICSELVGIGSEECKERPCVILQYNSANRTSPNTLVAPITHTTSVLFIVVPITEKRDSTGKLILDINHYYQTLQNMYNDKLQYIGKLKNNRTLLQSDLDSKKQQIDRFQKLLDTYHFSDIQNLAEFLEKSLKET